MTEKEKYKFNINDTVFIADSEGIPDMIAKRGTYATIIKRERLIWGGVLYNSYRIKEDSFKWAWREDWLRGVYELKNENIVLDEKEFESLFAGD